MLAGGGTHGAQHEEYLMHEFEKPINALIVEKSLIGLPSHRVGYSDRTAWLMATLSQLAYFQFENKKTMSEVAADLAKLTDKEEISSYLQNIIGAFDHGDAENRRDFLAQILKCAEFELIDVFDVGSTQAFLARRKSETERDKMLVLAFRGTEKRLEDWKADLKAKLVPARDEVKIGRIHQGFQEAYYSVENLIEGALKRFPGEPLYITGHSLGGALAVVATRFIDANNIAACYTYGCPRVGDLELASVFKSPIYRIVNAADLVPRLPLGYGYVLFLRALKLLTSFLPKFQILERMYDYLDMMTGYIHYGDERYLTVSEPGPNDIYPNLSLISNPSVFLLAERFWRRVKATRGKGLINDHSIGIYRAKLRARAISRN